MPKGRISISRIHGVIEEICVEVIDDISGVKFLEARMDLETFAQIITGLSHQPCEFDLHHLDRVGMKRETKHEIVPRPTKYRTDKEADKEKDKILAPYEVDGWKARRDDMNNHHNWVGKDKVNVVFVRFVPNTPSENDDGSQ